MDGVHFDALTRRLHSRRTALAALLGGVVALLGRHAKEARAHDPASACTHVKHPRLRHHCLLLAAAHRRKHHQHRRKHRQRHRCKPKSAARFCPNRCGTARNNCQRKVACTCPAGKTCLANFGCNRTCTMPGSPPGDCPPGCICGAFLAENPATSHCYREPFLVSCLQVPLQCETNANCPRGSFCGLVSCGPEDPFTGRCIPNCPT